MKNLRIARERKKINQRKLGVDIGVSQESISKYERGKSYPNAETLIKLADYFNTTTDYLLGRTDVSISFQNFTLDGLTPEELELLSEFRKLGYKQKNRVLGFILAMTE